MLDPPMGAIYLRAVFLAQRSGLTEVGVDEFLAPLDLPEIDSFLNMDDFDPRVDTPPIRPGRFLLSDELQKALTSAGWRTLGETITRDPRCSGCSQKEPGLAGNYPPPQDGVYGDQSGQASR